MASLPESATDPFSSLEARIRATMDLYRFGRTGASLIDWAAMQTGLKDPMSRFARPELEQFFERFAGARDQHLKGLLEDARRKQPGLIDAIVSSATDGAKARRHALTPGITPHNPHAPRPAAHLRALARPSRPPFWERATHSVSRHSRTDSGHPDPWHGFPLSGPRLATCLVRSHRAAAYNTRPGTERHPMNEQDFNDKIGELISQIDQLPEGSRADLHKLVEETRERQQKIRSTVRGLQESLDYLRLSVKYLVFDLEATRRENEYLRRMLGADNSKQEGSD
jgi:hypothetical protein